LEDQTFQSDWKTPDFAKIKGKKAKRISSYLESEIWDRDDILFITKFELYKRNKAALTLFWDLDARNHEITLLKIKHLRLKERYGEGEVPYEAKTGSGPVLLTCSFPYVRDWLNEHPFKIVLMHGLFAIS
jgi:integrase/recombinase XerD